MGSALALRWAARHPDRIDRVVCWGAPIYPSPAAARAHISGSAVTRLFVVDPAWAARACAISCRHRVAAGWLTAATEPQLPTQVARAVPQHTWAHDHRATIIDRLHRRRRPSPPDDPSPALLRSAQLTVTRLNTIIASAANPASHPRANSRAPVSSNVGVKAPSIITRTAPWAGR